MTPRAPIVAFQAERVAAARLRCGERLGGGRRGKPRHTSGTPSRSYNGADFKI
jgi:hypothetical protein